jgi:two-component system phosphate regulon response regulator OmpR
MTLSTSSSPEPAGVKNALVVDDDPAMVRLLQSFLTREGFRVSTALSAEEAIAADPLAFDLVLSDLNMPGKGGVGLLEWIRRHETSARVILMSGDFPRSGPLSAALARADGLLRKPFLVSDVRAALRDARLQ